ncbi:MAG: hypothetical protein WA957_06950 [Alteraurantiacibacter sp.]
MKPLTERGVAAKVSRRMTGRSVIADSPLAREFQADHSNQEWLADLTPGRSAKGWFYVATVFDPFFPRIVGGAMKADGDAALVVAAVMMAGWHSGKAAALPPVQPEAPSLETGLF